MSELYKIILTMIQLILVFVFVVVVSTWILDQVGREKGIKCEIEPVPLFELRLKHTYRDQKRYDLYMIDEKGEYRVGHGIIERPLFNGKSFEMIVVKPE